MQLPSCTDRQNRDSWLGVVVVHHIFVPNQRHFEFITNYDIMRACPVLLCGCITSFVKFSRICLGRFDFVRAGKFRAFHCFKYNDDFKVLGTYLSKPEQSVPQLEHIQSSFSSYIAPNDSFVDLPYCIKDKYFGILPY